jgi:hypothetical protein
LTWKVLTLETQQIIHRSSIRTADNKDKNMRAKLICGEKKNDPNLHSRQDDEIILDAEQPSIIFDDKTPKPQLIKPEDKNPKPPLINTEDFIGGSFLLDEEKYGQRSVI